MFGIMRVEDEFEVGHVFLAVFGEAGIKDAGHGVDLVLEEGELLEQLGGEVVVQRGIHTMDDLAKNIHEEEVHGLEIERGVFLVEGENLGVVRRKSRRRHLVVIIVE